MSIKTTLISWFPGIYQSVYEYRTNKLVKKYKCGEASTMLMHIKNIYKKRTGLELDINNPENYTEKIQWRKLFGSEKIYSELSDKYAVRKWVGDKIGEEFLIPLLGVWNSFDEIDFSSLPEMFVLKTTNASGTNIIVTNKDKLNLRLTRRKLTYWLKLEYWYAFGYEMQYKDIEPRIIAEAYILPEKGATDLKDYKFLCFNGKVKYIWVDLNRYHNHKRIVFDEQWNRAKFNQLYPLTQETVARPENLQKMITLVEKLAAGFEHVRVDLYNNDGKIYFGEMTFTNGSGFEPIIPVEWNRKLGDMWKESHEEQC